MTRSMPGGVIVWIAVAAACWLVVLLSVGCLQGEELCQNVYTY